MKRKVTATRTGRVKRVTQNAVFDAAYERVIGQGGCTLLADLTAWVEVAWTFCGCAACSSFTEPPMRLTQLISASDSRRPDTYLARQQALMESCWTAQELMRLNTLYYAPRKMVVGAMGSK